MRTKITHITYIISLLLILLCNLNKSNGQATSANGTNQPISYGPVDYIGWNSTTPIPLEIRTDETAHPQPINFYTSATPRMQIYDSLGMPNAGFVGIGDFSAPFAPQHLLHLHNASDDSTYIQWTNPYIGPGVDNGLKIGISWETTVADANIDQQEDAPLNFYTHDTLRALIDHVGLVGINTPTPQWQLDVRNGININNPTFTNYYMINGNRVLSNPGIGNIFAGVGTGLNHISSELNTVVGYHAGDSLKYAWENVFIGCFAGKLDTGDIGNPVKGSHNVFVGDIAGENNRTGYLNTFLGAHTGGSIVGLANLCVGYGATCLDDTNSIAIGANAKVLNSNKMILGDSSVDVGIGLSNVPGGPLRKLEINDADSAQLRLTNIYTERYTDFQTTANGDLYIHTDSLSTEKFVGVNTPLPNNTVEISSGVRSPYYNSGYGSSGLRFSHLTKDSVPVPNGTNGVDTTKVLSVDTNGDVVLVRAGGGSIINADNGLNIGAPGIVYLGGKLLQHTNIILPVYNLRMDGDTNRTGTVGIGTSDSTAKLNVDGSAHLAIANGSNTEIAAWFKSVDIDPLPDLSFGNKITVTGAKTSNVGTDISVMCPTTSTNNIGASSFIGGYSYGTNYAGYFDNEVQQAAGVSNDNYGVYGKAINGNKLSVGILGEAAYDIYGTSIGIFGKAHNSHTCVGVYGIADSVTGTGYGGYFENIDTTSGNNWAGWFEGSVRVNGPGIINTTWTASDQILKTNVQSINNASDIISQLRPRSYNYITNNPYGLNFGGEKQYGLIAQDVQEVLPEMVRETTKPEKRDTAGNIISQALTYKVLNYNSLFAIMLKGMQEQQQRIDSLRDVNALLDARLSALEDRVTNCCGASGGRPDNHDNSSSSSIDVELSNVKAIILNQNVPNPFAEQTTISYFIPDNAGKVQIIFYDNTGTILKVVDIKEKGKGQLNVFASDLSSGIYTYSLIADGKLIETKHMVCNK